MRYHRHILIAGVLVIIGLVIAPLLRGQSIEAPSVGARLEWVPVSDWGTGNGSVGVYRVWRRTLGESNWIQVAQTTETAIDLEDAPQGLTGHAWRLTAWNGVLESEPSAEVLIGRPSQPGSPRILIEIR